MLKIKIMKRGICVVALALALVVGVMLLGMNQSIAGCNVEVGGGGKCVGSGPAGSPPTKYTCTSHVENYPNNLPCILDQEEDL